MRAIRKCLTFTQKKCCIRSFRVYKAYVSGLKNKINQRKEKGKGNTKRKRKKRKQPKLIIIGEAVKASSVLFCPQS